MNPVLKKCGRDGCNPVAQTRCEMKPEDYHMQMMRYEAVKSFTDDIAVHGIGTLKVKDFWRDAHEVDASGRDDDWDMRVSCSKCGLCIGWDRRDIEKYENVSLSVNKRVVVARDGNLNAIWERWNDLVDTSTIAGI
jgi:hypothetical protein